MKCKILSTISHLLILLALFGCGGTKEQLTVPSTSTHPLNSTTAQFTTTAVPQTTSSLTITTSNSDNLPPKPTPPLPISDFPALGGAYNPPDPGQPLNTFYVDAYELRPNIIVVKAPAKVSWVDVDAKSLYVSSADGLFSGVICPLESPLAYTFTSLGAYVFTISPFDATEIGVVVVW